MTAFSITTKSELLGTIAQCSHEAAHIVPLLTAAYRDELSLACIAPGRAAPLSVLDRARRPATVIVGDDYGLGFDPGPAGFAGLPRLLRWARFAVINATGGVPAHYQMFVRMTIEHRRFVLIETGTSRADAWLKVCLRARVPTLVIKPEDGGFHPVLPKRGRMH